jgi:hypothetical protein
MLRTPRPTTSRERALAAFRAFLRALERLDAPRRDPEEPR